MLEVLSSPKRFFENLESFGWKVPVLVALFVSIPSSVIQYSVMKTIAPLLPPEAQQFRDALSLLGIFSIIPTFIITFLMILLIAGVIHLISGFFGGEGEFRKTATIVGYGMIPSVIVAYIQMAIFLYSLGQAGQFTSLHDFLAFMTDQNRMLSSAVLSTAALLWNVAIWSNGVEVVRKIEFRKAVISASVPALIYLAYTLYSLNNLANMGNFGAI
ncbi:YIP1 family protein [Geoglobus sp.]